MGLQHKFFESGNRNCSVKWRRTIDAGIIWSPFGQPPAHSGGTDQSSTLQQSERCRVRLNLIKLNSISIGLLELTAGRFFGKSQVRDFFCLLNRKRCRPSVGIPLVPGRLRARLKLTGNFEINIRLFEVELDLEPGSEMKEC